MSYKVESVNGCTRKIVFNFETVDLTTEIKAAVMKKQRNVNLKGFRKGKAPVAMVEKMFGPQLEYEALNQFVQTQFFEVVKKEDLKVVGYPSFDNMKYDKGKSVSFDATVEVFPEIALKDYSKYSFKKDSTTVTDEDLENVKKSFLTSKSELTEVKDPNCTLEKGKFSVINFEGEKENGEKPDNMKASEFMLEIGSGQFIPGFEDGLIGMKKGEKKTLTLTFPAEYQMPDLQNAKVKFHVELIEIKERKLPEFKDELVKELGFATTKDFLDKNRETLKKQKERTAEQKLHQEILEKFVGDNTFDVPHALIRQQEDHLKNELRGTLQGQGFNDSMMEEYFSKWHGDLQKKAEFQVKSAVVLDTLAKKYKVEVKESDFKEKFDEMASSTGMKVEQVEKFYTENSNAKNNLNYAVREEKTFAQLVKEIKVS